MLIKLPDCTEHHTCFVCKKWMNDAKAELVILRKELKELRQMKKDFQEICRFKGV